MVLIVPPRPHVPPPVVSVGHAHSRTITYVPIREKVVSEISAADIFDLITQQTPEDLFLEFKAEMLDPGKPKDKLEFDKADWVADVVAFANAQGGHILIGLQADGQERAAKLKPIVGDQAKRLADQLRDLAIERIKPSMAQLEVAPIAITPSEWIVVARVPHSSDKPHISSHNGRTRFTPRDGNRKRDMHTMRFEDSSSQGRRSSEWSGFRQRSNRSTPGSRTWKARFERRTKSCNTTSLIF